MKRAVAAPAAVRAHVMRVPSVACTSGEYPGNMVSFLESALLAADGRTRGSLESDLCTSSSRVGQR